jgi:hypothetical protein
MAGTTAGMAEPSKPASAQAHLLFAQVQFYIVPSPGLQGELAESVGVFPMTWSAMILTKRA